MEKILALSFVVSVFSAIVFIYYIRAAKKKWVWLPLVDMASKVLGAVTIFGLIVAIQSDLKNLHRLVDAAEHQTQRTLLYSATSDTLRNSCGLYIDQEGQWQKQAPQEEALPGNVCAWVKAIATENCLTCGDRTYLKLAPAGCLTESCRGSVEWLMLRVKLFVESAKKVENYTDAANAIIGKMWFWAIMMLTIVPSVVLGLAKVAGDIWRAWEQSRG